MDSLAFDTDASLNPQPKPGIGAYWLVPTECLGILPQDIE